MSKPLSKIEMIGLLKLIERLDREVRLKAKENDLKNRLIDIIYDPEEIPYCNCEKPFVIAGSKMRPYCNNCYGVIR